MAWNEPGGKRNNQDPWRGGGGEGPPDLDELFKKLHKKLSGVFGGGSGGGSNSKKDAGGGGLFLTLGIVALALWAGSGIYRVEEAERAVVLRFGKFHAVKTAGLHWYPPLIDEVMTVDVDAVGTHTVQGSMLTEDQKIVDVQLEVQYRIADAEKYQLRNADPMMALKLAAESALRHVVGGSKMESMISEDRRIFSVDVQARLQEYLDAYDTGLLISKVVMRDASPPEPVQDAFDDVLRAKAEQERLGNEAEKFAAQEVPEARGRAAKTRASALAYKIEVVEGAKGEAQRFSLLLDEYRLAPKVTRERLYIDAMESMLTSSSKVLMDTGKGQNLTYLPLDRLIGANASGPSMTNEDRARLRLDLDAASGLGGSGSSTGGGDDRASRSRSFSRAGGR